MLDAAIALLSGSVVRFPFPMPIHPVLARELRQSKRLQKFFDSLPDSTRHQIDREVREVKRRDAPAPRATCR